MIIAIGITIGIIMGINEIIQLHDDFFDWFGGFVVSLGSSITLGLIGLVISYVISISAATEIPNTEIIKLPIYSLQDNFANSGIFHYGRGYYEEELNYYFLTEADKGKKIDHKKVNNTYLNFIPEEETPFIEIHYKDYIINNKFISFLCAPCGMPRHEEDYCVLNIPKDSVTTEVSIDLQ